MQVFNNEMHIFQQSMFAFVPPPSKKFLFPYKFQGSTKVNYALIEIQESQAYRSAIYNFLHLNYRSDVTGNVHLQNQRINAK